jgi:hypothetical protein
LVWAWSTTRRRSVGCSDSAIGDGALEFWKALDEARRLRGQNQLPKVVNCIKFKDGIEAFAEIKSAA